MVCLRVFARIGLTFFSDLDGDFDIVRLEVFFTAFEKIISGIGFSLGSFCMACSLGIRSFVWIWTITVYFFNIRQFLENAWWFSPQWQHLTLVLGHFSLLCPWQLYFPHVAIVSWHIFTV